MRILCLLGIAVVLGLVASTAWTQTDDELRAIYFRRDLVRMEEIARTGDVRAEAWMGLMLQNRGRRAEAKEWWRRAAEKGNAWAIGSLARMHLHDGENEQAAQWYRRGAEAGHANAQASYAWLLLQGRGVAKDEPAAARWYSAAAAQGCGYCYLVLAKLHANGTGVARDPVEAYALATLAEVVFHNTTSDIEMYGEELAQLKAQVEKELSPAQMKAASLRARAMRPELDLDRPRIETEPFGLLLGLVGLGLGTVAGTIMTTVIYRHVRRAFR